MVKTDTQNKSAKEYQQINRTSKYAKFVSQCATEKSCVQCKKAFKTISPIELACSAGCWFAYTQITRRQTRSAIDLGQIAKQIICQVCGDNKRVNAHHTDYSKYDLLEWLCWKCHMKAHSKIKADERAIIIEQFYKWKHAQYPSEVGFNRP